MPSGYPTFDQIRDEILQFVERHATIARLEALGESDEGRPVDVVFVTDPAVPDDDKQVALIVNVRHGDERGTWGIGPALLEMLASPASAEILRSQTVVVVPVANPDGCARNEFLAPRDTLSDTELRTIVELARRIVPDLVVDIHSLSGYDSEFVLAAHVAQEGEDTFIHQAMMARLVGDLAEVGYPFFTSQVKGGYNNFFCGLCHEECHPLVFGLEVNHLSLTCDEAAESGGAAVCSLLNWGSARQPWQAQPGYPNGILLGNFHTSLRPAGANASERRSSRAALWRSRAGFSNLKRALVEKTKVRVTFDYDGEPLESVAQLVCRVRGRLSAVEATLDGSPARSSMRHEKCSTYVACELPVVRPGKHELILVF